mgnify:CR=1 FL=1
MHLSRFPRVHLAHLPTPLEHMKRLSKELGTEIWVKRDDCTIRRCDHEIPNIVRRLAQRPLVRIDQPAGDAAQCGFAAVVWNPGRVHRASPGHRNLVLFPQG